MPDIVTKEKRSQVMAAVRSRGNRATELRLVSILRMYRITGWRRHLPLFGRPDFIFRRERLAVFVDGCFWHGCRWHCRVPKGHHAYWRDKIKGNMCRDRTINQVMRRTGWKVLRIWEHSLRTPWQVAEQIVSQLSNARIERKAATKKQVRRACC